jgi:DNA-binding NarL/FixJ family response regulator
VKKIKVLICDDHPVFQEGLCRLLREQDDMEVVAQASNGKEAIALAGKSSPDVLILDISLPDMNGIEVAEQIKASRPDIAILILSAYDYSQYVLASIRAGVAGYLLKNTPLAQIAGSVRLLHDGQTVFNLKATNKFLHRAPLGSDKTGFKDLCPREIEVLKLAAKGLSNKKIAGELAISNRTVQTHLVNIFRKLKVHSRSGAVFHALKEGWLTINDLP